MSDNVGETNLQINMHDNVSKGDDIFHDCKSLILCGNVLRDRTYIEYFL